MRFVLVCVPILFLMQMSVAQQLSINGRLIAINTGQAVVNAQVYLEGTLVKAHSDSEGNFRITDLNDGIYILHVNALDFLGKHFEIEIKGQNVNLGKIYMELDIEQEKTDNLIALTASDLADNSDVTSSPGILQATKDLYLKKAAFDFSQVFFRIRGYDSNYGMVLLNGHNLNKFLDGRPQWNNWGGLNDITRNRELAFGLKASPHGFGNLLGVTNIDTRPSKLRPGTRLTVSLSNRIYSGRLMATHLVARSGKGLSWAVSGSRRWAKSGYIDATPYNASSLFAALEYAFNSKNNLNFSALMAFNKRGQSAAITEEVFDLKGNKYNPNWGRQGELIRSSKVRKISEPIVMLNYNYQSERFQFRGGIAYQFGRRTRSRLGNYNAPNPDPIYYKYLPSTYINRVFGANFVNAALAKEGFLRNSQIAWESLYEANANASAFQKASYILYDDVVDDKLFSISGSANLLLNVGLSLNLGLAFRQLKSNSYARINDLLGATGHQDTDPFSNTRNDQLGSMEKTTGDKFNYHYNLEPAEMQTFAQLQIARNKWEAFITGSITTMGVLREGLFSNERYPLNSLGRSKRLNFLGIGAKIGGMYKLTGRQWFSANAMTLQRAPTLNNLFINPRENNTSVPEIANEVIASAEMGYHFRFPDLMGRITTYYTSIRKGTDINFFYADSGLGSDFVQEVITELEKLHFGVEFSLKYQMSSAVSLNFAGTVAKYIFSNDPLVSIYFDAAKNELKPISLSGNATLGRASLKDYRLPQGPQEAYSIGIDYRDPKYWWIGVTANYLANNYIGISTISRTPSFWLDPQFPADSNEFTAAKVPFRLPQKRTDDIYLLNLTAGKSWLKKGTYISVFASINNVFNSVFKSGGFEQSRNANYKQFEQDHLSGSPSFGNKYWFGFGRTFFINLAYSF